MSDFPVTRGMLGDGSRGLDGASAPDSAPGSILLRLVDRIDALAERVSALSVVGEGPRRRTAQLREHIARHVRPRAMSLEAPLLILLLGPTGAGKSSLFNALIGRNASQTGVLRPTTRQLVALARPSDRDVLVRRGGPLSGIGDNLLRLVLEDDAPEGLVIVDAPDVDSIEHANRELTDRLVEAADLAVFVTTATRYADRVPWEVLGRVRDRGLPLVVIVNRMPADAADRAVVLDDLTRLLAGAGLVDADRGMEIDLVPVPEGSLDPSIDGLDRSAVQPLLDRIAELASDRDARLELASRALTGSLGGLEPHLRSIADDLDHAAIDADRLRRIATDAYERELGSLRDELAGGAFLRAEALRQWHAFVGADEITRLFSSGIGRFRATISTLVRGAPPAPVAEVREQTVADLRALARVRLGEAARRAAVAWSEEPVARQALERDPSVWSPSPDLDARLEQRLDAWVTSIADDVQTTGGPKRLLARGASIGVNATGIAVMLATFSHTGGLTGAEVGVAAATGFLNQKLLGALFGEAALVEMITRARVGLIATLGETFREELARFDALIPPPAGLRSLATELRTAADEVRTLPPTISVSDRAITLPDIPRLDELPRASTRRRSERR
ncbi:MAG TPA: GTPase domain-containing protein [Candidatus Limnocylindrales bacterium]